MLFMLAQIRKVLLCSHWYVTSHSLLCLCIVDPVATPSFITSYIAIQLVLVQNTLRTFLSHYSSRWPSYSYMRIQTFPCYILLKTHLSRSCRFRNDRDLVDLEMIDFDVTSKHVLVTFLLCLTQWQSLVRFKFPNKTIL